MNERRSAEAAADHDPFRVEEVDERADGRAEDSPDPSEELDGLPVPLVREPDEPMCVGRRAENLLSRLTRGDARAVGLHVAAAPARAGLAVVDDDHVARLRPPAAERSEERRV